MTYRKIGGLHHFRLWRFGVSWYWAKTPQAKARANGWIAEREYNGEDDGVRHPTTGDWAEDWSGACAQGAKAKHKAVPTREPLVYLEGMM